MPEKMDTGLFFPLGEISPILPLLAGYIILCEGLDFDPAGFFIIYIDKSKKEIVVEHYLNVEKKGAKVATGRLNAVMRGKNAEKLSRAIVEAGLVSRLDHAAYVGRELHKAELALKKGVRYEQDGPLRL